MTQTNTHQPSGDRVPTPFDLGPDLRSASGAVQGTPSAAFSYAPPSAAPEAGSGQQPEIVPETLPIWAPGQRVVTSPEEEAAEAAARLEELRITVAELNPGAPLPDVGLILALQQVLLAGASDLHIATDAVPRLRVDGGLTQLPDAEKWDRLRVREALFSLLDDELRARFNKHLELDFAYTLDVNARFRVNYFQDRGALGAAFRVIPTKIKPLRELGIGPEVGALASLPRGLVLVTGATGSGKSTTLAALIDLVNETRRDHVVTVEDPIEFLHRNKRSLVNQREVGRDTHSFANALKHVLRQDPDVILIGELRDLETISTALTAAETGHLVFATLHTQSAASTIDRLIDVFPPHQQDQVRTQLAATLQGVVCQTLVKKASGAGRVVATEVMFTTPAVANLVREGKTYQLTSVLQSGQDQGMHTLDQSLAELVNSGTITRETALEKSQDPETLTRLVTRVGGAAVDDGFDAIFEQRGTR